MTESIVEIFPECENMRHVHMGPLERYIVGSNGVPTIVLRLSFDRQWEISKMPGREQAVKGLRKVCRSQWPRGLRRRSTAARLLRSWVRIPPGAWMSVCCECFVLSGRGLCDELNTRPEASYRLWCVSVCYRTSLMRSQTSINSDWTYEISLEGTSPR